VKNGSSPQPAGEPSLEIDYRQIALEIAARHPEAGPVRFKITSDSMRPLLRPGDIVIISRLNAGKMPQRGDIIMFQTNNSTGGSLPLTHRLIGASASGWLTKGDFCWFPDAPVDPSAVIGQAIAIQRGERRIDLSTPTWRLTSRLLGWIHYFVAILLNSARQLRKSLEDQ
jgi:signal peptidase I